MAELHDIANYLNSELKIAELPDYPLAYNGLQLENATMKVTKIATAVDASLPVIQKAITSGADFLLVHHGIFWQGLQPLTGAHYKKIKSATESNLAIYSAHIPLDIHPHFGNNALLAKALNFENGEPFFDWQGIKLGLRFSSHIKRQDILMKIEKALGATPHICPAGPEIIGKIGIITGGAGSEVAQVTALGIDTFITGEGQHWTYPLAEELQINLIYAGHYATETFGVKALGQHLQEKFSITMSYIDHPSGL